MQRLYVVKMSFLSNESAPLFPDDVLPLECDYESQGTLIKPINAWAERRGYAFITGRSTKERSGKRTITYACDRSCYSPYISRERQRKTTARGIGCKFSVLAKESLDRCVGISCTWYMSLLIRIKGLTYFTSEWLTQVYTKSY
jgi:hypothetical protein